MLGATKVERTTTLSLQWASTSTLSQDLQDKMALCLFKIRNQLRRTCTISTTSFTWKTAPNLQTVLLQHSLQGRTVFLTAMKHTSLLYTLITSFAMGIYVCKSLNMMDQGPLKLMQAFDQYINEPVLQLLSFSIYIDVRHLD